ncbi:MAG: hypothetical protein FJ247_12250 [Nitrospira sp.]|nr:hypothetical protein [Nitrospira sp.]
MAVMQSAAKRKNWWRIGLVSALILTASGLFSCAATFASSVAYFTRKTRAEVFGTTTTDRVEFGCASPETASRYYDAPAKVASDSSVAPNKVPNPYGKLGSPAHRAKVQEVIADIERRGLKYQTEYPVKTINGVKDTRFMDVVAIDPKTGRIVEVHQVGRRLKSDARVPVSRERDALRDVRHSPEVRDAKRIFHDYE